MCVSVHKLSVAIGLFQECLHHREAQGDCWSQNIINGNNIHVDTHTISCVYLLEY